MSNISTSPGGLTPGGPAAAGLACLGSGPTDLARPGLTLFIGPANSGKQGRLLDWWQERTGLGPVLVAPNAPDAAELTLDAVRRFGGLVGAGAAITFDRLMAQVLGRSPRYVSGFERRLILQRLIAGARLQQLEPMLEFPGTFTALANLLRRLDESGRPPGDIDGVLTRWGKEEPSAAGLAADIALVTQRYAAVLAEEGLTERPAAVRAATEHVASWRRPVALYGFTSFTPGQQNFVEALLACVPVALSLAFERGRPVSIVDEAEAAHWERLAVGRVVTLKAQSRAYSSPQIAYLERRFSDGPSGRPAEEGAAGDAGAGGGAGTQGDELPPVGAAPDRPPPPPGDTPHGVRFLMASGQRNEAELAARHIVQLIRQGFDPGRIGVVVRHPRSWGSLLTDVFTSCGIPWRLDTGREFGRTGLGYALLAALRGWAYDDGEALLDFLRTSYSGLDLEAAAQIETFYRRGVPRGAYVVARLLGRNTPRSLTLAGEVLDRSGREATLDLGRLQELGLEFLRAGLQGVSATSRDAEEDARAFAALCGAVRSLESLSRRGARPEWSTAKVVLSALGDINVPAGPVEGQRAVQIVSPHRTKARRFDALFVLGLVEGEFPARGGLPLLLTEAQRARLDSLGEGGLLPPDTDGEAALFLSAISRPWQALYLSTRDADDGGGAAVPSQLWLRSRAIFGLPKEHVDAHRTLADQVFVAVEAPTPRHLARTQAACARISSRQAGEGAFKSWYRETPRLCAPAILAELATRDVFSPSELEKHLRCPFAWFLEKVVGAKDLEIEFDGMVIGGIMHEALKTTYRELRQAGMLPLRSQHLPRAKEVAFAAVDKAVARDDVAGASAEKVVSAFRLKRMIGEMLRWESESGSRMAMVDTEASIGGYEGVDIGGLRLRGRIDRVDADSSGKRLFVLDYKSGGIPSPKKLGTEEGLQLPLYLMALTADNPQARVIGGAYHSLKNRGRSGVVSVDAVDLLGAGSEGCLQVDEVGEQELFDTTLRTATAAADGIRSGIIAPQAGKACPRWCDLGPICRARKGNGGW